MRLNGWQRLHRQASTMRKRRFIRLASLAGVSLGLGRARMAWPLVHLAGESNPLTGRQPRQCSVACHQALPRGMHRPTHHLMSRKMGAASGVG